MHTPLRSLSNLLAFNGQELNFDGLQIIDGDVFATRIEINGDLMVHGSIFCETDIIVQNGNLICEEDVYALKGRIDVPDGSIVCGKGQDGGFLYAADALSVGHDIRCYEIDCKKEVSCGGVLRATEEVCADGRVQAGAGLFAYEVNCKDDVICGGLIARDCKTRAFFNENPDGYNAQRRNGFSHEAWRVFAESRVILEKIAAT